MYTIRGIISWTCSIPITTTRIATRGTNVEYTPRCVIPEPVGEIHTSAEGPTHHLQAPASQALSSLALTSKAFKTVLIFKYLSIPINLDGSDLVDTEANGK